MPENPYSELFGREHAPEQPERAHLPIEQDGFAIGNQTEPLDEIKHMIAAFKQESDAFSTFLTKTRAIDHLDEARSAHALLSIFIDTGKNQWKGSLTNERAHYTLLQEKYSGIIEQMKELALAHLQVVKRFNSDIDANYYSVEKTQEVVKTEIQWVVDQINLQRRILGDAARDLDILQEAMEATEHRLRKCIDTGGINNLSRAEFAVLKQTRVDMTNGYALQFNYKFFDLTLLDQLALVFDIYLKKTTGQYVQNLLRAMNQRE